MHGDTKIENFMIEPKTNKVIGVIDMELAEFPGIPLIDLFFLINLQLSHRRTRIIHRSIYQNCKKQFIQYLQNRDRKLLRETGN